MKEAIVGLVPYSGSYSMDTLDNNDMDPIDMINARLGGDLKVGDLLDFRTGIFPQGLSKFEKRAVSDVVPIWKSENCIQCGMCSMVCPHAVIRPFVIDKDDKYAQDGISLIGEQDGKYKYIISVSEADCTGCG